MSTTVDELIGLKDQAVEACQVIVTAWKDGEDIGAAVDLCESVTDRSELYDAAEASDAVSLEAYEQGEADCELPGCWRRDPDGKRGHKQRECNGGA